LNSNFDPGNQKAETDDQGLLEVFALLPAGASPESFSWIRDWESHQTAATSPERTMLAWAFNPQARCRNP
jgi:hypothetical protein